MSTGRSGGIRGGDPLPWLPIEEGDNFEPLTSVDWQLHVYGRPAKNIRHLSDRSGLPIHYTRWTKDMKKKGIKRNGAFLVRPDRHVGVAATTANIRPIKEYVERFSLKMNGTLHFFSPLLQGRQSLKVQCQIKVTHIDENIESPAI
ncbi:hypothetical protein [Salinicoccus roseus]|uniref:hypothetical protein n=1 Tax=Salinicoccus roseus TaxID=45670 RepID=UPI003DA1B635